MLEADLAAKMEFECRIRGAQFLAYPPVVAGGWSDSVSCQCSRRIECYCCGYACLHQFVVLCNGTYSSDGLTHGCVNMKTNTYGAAIILFFMIFNDIIISLIIIVIYNNFFIMCVVQLLMITLIMLIIVS